MIDLNLIGRKNLKIGGHTVKPDQKVRVVLETGQLYTGTPMQLPIQIVHGRKKGPTLLVSAAIHGDELNGVEIVRRLFNHPDVDNIKGTLILVPIANLLGFLHHSRYLPDRRDLNRSFPGSPKGSLAQRVAHIFVSEVLSHADYLVDLHTAAIHRTNMPQVRTDTSLPENVKLAEAFGHPFVMDSSVVEGSLREQAQARGIPAITYEAGEALRFDETSIRIGVHGIMSILRQLKMLPGKEAAPQPPMIIEKSTWLRAETDGIVRSVISLGSYVREGQVIAHIDDPMGGSVTTMTSPMSGLVVGKAKLPLMHSGEALYNIAHVEDTRLLENIRAYYRKVEENVAHLEPAAE